MSFFRNFTFNINPNADIELKEIEEGSGSVLISSNISASTPISHPLSAFTSDVAQNPDIEIPDVSRAISGDVTTPADIPLGNPHPESHAVEQNQDSQTTQAPVMNPLPDDCTMTDPDNPYPPPISHPLSAFTFKLAQNPNIIKIPDFSLATSGDLKRSHNERERTDKVRVVEQRSRLPVCPYIAKQGEKTDSNCYSARKQCRCPSLSSRNTRMNFSKKPPNSLIRWLKNLKCARESLSSSI